LLAWSLVEIFWAEVWARNFRENDRATLDRALLVGQRAVLLDGNDAWCHIGLVYVHFARKSFDLAAHHLDIATRLNPNDSEIVTHRAMLEEFTGRPQEALHLTDLVLRLNPSPRNDYWITRGLALYHLRRYEEAAKAFKRATASRPYVYRYRAACYAQLDEFEDARDMVAESLRLQPGFSLRRWTVIEPYGSQADLEHMLDGMRKAGLPE
jgi:adenylate cyclase